MKSIKKGTYRNSPLIWAVLLVIILMPRSTSAQVLIVDGGDTYTLSAPIQIFYRAELIGYSSNGTFIQTGGVNQTPLALTIGVNSGSSGSYNLIDGILSSTSQAIGHFGTGTFAQSGGTNYAGSLDIGYYAGGTGSYTLSGGDLRSITGRVGYTGIGTFNQTGGAYTISGDLYLGYGTGGRGKYAQSGGTNSVAGGLYLGYGAGSSSTFTQSEGTNTVSGDLYLGYGSGASGTYTQSGGTLISAGQHFVGFSGTGTFNQTGGFNQSAGLWVGLPSYSAGTYTLSGGSLKTMGETISFIGTGVFNQTGGSNQGEYLIIGSNPTAFGTYSLSGGSLETMKEYVGVNGTGVFNQTGGSNTVAGDLYLSFGLQGSGTYTQSGGTLSAAQQFIGFNSTGVFNQSSGTNTVAGDLYLGYFFGSSGTYTLSGGTLSTGQQFIGYNGTGLFNQIGGTNTVAGSLILAANAGSIGTYNLQGGSLTAGVVELNSGGIFNQTGGALNAAVFNQRGGEVRGSLENRGTFNYTGGLFGGRLFNYGAVNFNADFTAGNGLTNYSTLGIDAGRTVTLNGEGLDNQATFTLNGTLTGSGPFLNNGTGTLSGTGTIFGNLTNRGTINPGNSPGTLSVTGNYTQTSSGGLTVEIASPSSYDRLNVSGAVVLNGTLSPVLLSGYIPAGNQVFPGVITAAGDISGAFNSVADRYLTPTLLWQPRYNTDSVDLLVRRDYANSLLGLNANQQSVGLALNSLAGTATGDLETVLNKIDYLPNGRAVADALQQISADKVDALSTLAFAGANLQKRVLARRITDLRFDNSEFGQTSALPGYLNIGGSEASSDLSAAFKGESSRGIRSGIYLEPSAIFGGRDSTSDRTGFDFTVAGFTAGADFRVRENFLVGLATGYSHADADFHNSGGSVAAHTWPITLYGAYLPEPFYVYGSAGYALNLFDLNRDIMFGGLVRRADSSSEGHVFNTYVEAGYDLKLCRMVLNPMASLAYSNLWVDGFTETGADSVNLKVFPQDADSLQTGLGARAALPLPMNTFTLIPQVYASYQHEFSDGSRTIDARFSRGGPAFTFVTGGLGRDFAVLGADITLVTHRNLKFRLDYNAEVGRSDSTAHYLSGGLRWEF